MHLIFIIFLGHLAYIPWRGFHLKFLSFPFTLCRITDSFMVGAYLFFLFCTHSRALKTDMKHVHKNKLKAWECVWRGTVTEKTECSDLERKPDWVQPPRAKTVLCLGPLNWKWQHPFASSSAIVQGRPGMVMCWSSSGESTVASTFTPPHQRYKRILPTTHFKDLMGSGWQLHRGNRRSPDTNSDTKYRCEDCLRSAPVHQPESALESGWVFTEYPLQGAAILSIILLVRAEQQSSHTQPNHRACLVHIMKAAKPPRWGSRAASLESDRSR